MLKQCTIVSITIINHDSENYVYKKGLLWPLCTYYINMTWLLQRSCNTLSNTVKATKIDPEARSGWNFRFRCACAASVVE